MTESHTISNCVLILLSALCMTMCSAVSLSFDSGRGVKSSSNLKTLFDQNILLCLEGFSALVARCMISQVGRPDLNRVCHKRPTPCSLLYTSP